MRHLKENWSSESYRQEVRSLSGKAEDAFLKRCMAGAVLYDIFTAVEYSDHNRCEVSWSYCSVLTKRSSAFGLVSVFDWSLHSTALTSGVLPLFIPHFYHEVS